MMAFSSGLSVPTISARRESGGRKGVKKRQGDPPSPPRACGGGQQALAAARDADRSRPTGFFWGVFFWPLGFPPLSEAPRLHLEVPPGFPNRLGGGGGGAGSSLLPQRRRRVTEVDNPSGFGLVFFVFGNPAGPSQGSGSQADGGI